MRRARGNFPHRNFMQQDPQSIMRRWVLVYNVTQETMCLAVNALTQFGQISRCCMMDNNIFV